MFQLNKIIQWETNVGNQVVVGGLRLRPQSQALSIRCPYGGWVWNRPVAVVVEQDGRVRRMPVIDVTRLVQLGLFGLSLAFIIITLRLMLQQRRKQNE